MSATTHAARAADVADAVRGDETLTLVPVGTDDWLVHDTRFPLNDARRLLACARRRSPHEIDVIWLQGTHTESRFPNFDEVLAAAR